MLVPRLVPGADTYIALPMRPDGVNRMEVIGMTNQTSKPNTDAPVEGKSPEKRIWDHKEMFVMCNLTSKTYLSVSAPSSDPDST